MSNIIDSIQVSGVTYTIQGSGGGVPESAFTAYTASTDSRLAEDEEVTAAALNDLNDSLSGKVDTSSVVTTITSGSTNVQVPSAKCVYDQLGGLKLVQLTQSEYNILVTGGTVDNSTIYFIVN